jgi:hypothetical protein
MAARLWQVNASSVGRAGACLAAGMKFAAACSIWRSTHAKKSNVSRGEDEFASLRL